MATEAHNPSKMANDDDDGASKAMQIANAALEEALSNQRNEQSKERSSSENLRAPAEDSIPPDTPTELVNATGDETHHSEKGNRDSVAQTASKATEDGTANEGDVEGTLLQAIDDNKHDSTNGDKELEQKLRHFWQCVVSESDGDNAEKFQQAYEKTSSMMCQQVDALVKDGLALFQQCDRLQLELDKASETILSMTKENERLRAGDENHRKAIANLLRAVEASKGETRDSSKAALVEARLRAEIASLTSTRDEAVEDSGRYKRKYELLENEVKMTKQKLARVENDKIKLQREQHQTINLAKNLETPVATETDFYKRQVAQYKAENQGLKASLEEKDHQIAEYRRQMMRSMSQNRLAAFRNQENRSRRA